MLLLIIVALLLLFGGGGGYYGYSDGGQAGAWGSSGRSCSSWWSCTCSARCADLFRIDLTSRDTCWCPASDETGVPHPGGV
jgi:hypothetical protein